MSARACSSDRRLSHQVALLKLAAVALLMLLSLVGLGGCGPFGRGGASTPTPSPTLTATATATIIPTATVTATVSPPTPVPTPTRRPTPRPTATPVTICLPGSGVTPVSSTVIRNGSGSRRQVSLTFDSDGGSAGNAAAYLDILRAHGIHATWFLTGQFAQANPTLVRQIRNAGHDIGNHTVDHPDLISPPRTDAFICSELVNANRLISAASGQTTRPFFRPPNGDYNTQVRTLAARLGYRTITWSIDPRDWDSANSAQDIQNSILNSPNLKPGAIILMHVNSAHEAQALGGVIAGLELRGYAIVPLSQLLS
ncbi:MAG: polysaccharide deacetylase family protein [Nitrososphaerota archaeon]